MQNIKYVFAICLIACGWLFVACNKLKSARTSGNDGENIGQNDGCGFMKGHSYVDMGLSVKWATCNVGASSSEECGDQFAWGETSIKNDYDWWSYKHCKESYNLLTKYCTDANHGVVDSLLTLELCDDAAHATWGGQWRMPTKDEWIELRSNCDWIWSNQNGVDGYRVTSQKNGNSIFFPVAGDRWGTDLFGKGERGYYWSSTLYESYPRYAWLINFFSDNAYECYNGRYFGFFVRPVCE